MIYPPYSTYQLKEITEEYDENISAYGTLEWNRLAVKSRNIIDHKSSLNKEYEKIDYLSEKNNVALSDYLSIRSQLMELSMKVAMPPPCPIAI